MKTKGSLTKELPKPVKDMSTKDKKPIAQRYNQATLKHCKKALKT